MTLTENQADGSRIRVNAGFARMSAVESVRVVILCLLAVSESAFAAGPSDIIHLTQQGAVMPVGPEPYFVFAADLNGDDVEDLAIANRGPLKPPTDPQPGHETISVLIGRGDGTFHAARDYRVGFAPYTVEGGDFNEDGALDLAVACFQSRNDRDIAILTGRGDGTFEPADYLSVQAELSYDKNRLVDGSPLYASPGLTSVDIVDVDRDGHLDLVTVAWSSDLIVTFHGDGGGHFPRQQVTSGVPSGPRDVAACDFDRDGNPDLVLTHYNSDCITFWRGDGSGRFDLMQNISSGGKTPYHLELCDLNRDGHPDIVVGHRGATDNVTLLCGRGGFEFALERSVNAAESDDPQTAEYEIRDVIVADLNGDGEPEVAAACRRADTIIVWQLERRSGQIEFRPAGQLRLPGKGPRALAAGDFDGDGRIELAVTLGTAGQVTLVGASDESDR